MSAPLLPPSHWFSIVKYKPHPFHLTPPHHTKKSAKIRFTDCMQYGSWRVVWLSSLFHCGTRAAQYIQYEKFQKNSRSDTRIQNIKILALLAVLKVMKILKVLKELYESMTVLLEFGYLQCKSSRSCRI